MTASIKIWADKTLHMEVRNLERDKFIRQMRGALSSLGLLDTRTLTMAELSTKESSAQYESFLMVFCTLGPVTDHELKALAGLVQSQSGGLDIGLLAHSSAISNRVIKNVQDGNKTVERQEGGVNLHWLQIQHGDVD